MDFILSDLETHYKVIVLYDRDNLYMVGTRPADFSGVQELTMGNFSEAEFHERD